MKRPEQRERMSKNNPMKDPKIADYVNSQKRISVVVSGIEYSSIGVAVSQTGHSQETISVWCRRGYDNNGIECYYSNPNRATYSTKKFIPFTYLGVHYDTFNDFYDQTGISQTTLKKWLRNGYDSKGNVCRRDNDERDLVYLPQHVGSKSIIINGIRYDSISQATKILDLRKGYISDIIRGVISDDNYICTYDNQQPSQENVE